MSELWWIFGHKGWKGLKRARNSGHHLWTAPMLSHMLRIWNFLAKDVKIQVLFFEKSLSTTKFEMLIHICPDTQSFEQNMHLGHLLSSLQ